MDREDWTGPFRALLRGFGFTDEGWITEAGEFWPADREMPHGFVARCVLGLSEADAEAEADRRGWLRLSDYGNRTAAVRLNQRQRDTLWDWCQHHGLDFHEVQTGIGHL